MLDEIKNIKTEKTDLKKFGITIGIILFIVAVFLFYKNRESFRIFLGIGLVLISSGLIVPIILRPLYVGWMTFAIILGWFMTKVILSLLFYLLISPIGIFSRLIGKDFLGLNSDSTSNSYWNHRDRDKEKNQNYEKQY